MKTRGVWLVAVFLGAAGASAEGEAFEWKAGVLTLTGKGYVQGDLRTFPGWEVEPGLRDDRADVRRLRAGFEFKAKRLSGEFVVDGSDLANHATGDDDERPAFAPRTHFKDAYVELAFGKRHFLRAGHFKLPVSREHLTSAAKIDFVERSLLADGLAPDRDWGLMAGGKLDVAQGLSYWLGIFAGDGWSEDSRAETTGAGRLVLEPVDGLQLAVSGSLGTVTAAPTEGLAVAPEANGLRGKTASGFTFFRRPYVDGRRSRFGADLVYARGPLTLKAEVLGAREERNGQGARGADEPAALGVGWSAGGVFRLHGPRSKKDKAHGRTPLDLAVRYESLRFDDVGPGLAFEGAGNRASNIRPETARALTAGVSWEARPWVRLLGDVVLERYGDALFAPEPGRKGTYVTVIGRLQLVVP